MKSCKYVKTSRSDMIGSYICPISELQNSLDGELDGDNVAGTQIIIEFIEMTDEKYKSLSEFEGW